LEIDLDSHIVNSQGEVIDLTPTEFNLLATLAAQPGRAFTRLQLLDGHQGATYEGYERTIDAHIKNLRAKIEKDAKSPHYIETVSELGTALPGVMASMRLRLILSFVFIGLVSIVSVILLARQGVANEVYAYMFRGGMTGSEALVETLEAYYRDHHSWQGVESYFFPPGMEWADGGGIREMQDDAGDDGPAVKAGG